MAGKGVQGKGPAGKSTAGKGVTGKAKREKQHQPGEPLGDALHRLWQTIDSRRDSDPETSYTAKLFGRGPAKIAQKFGEEAVEAVIEGVRGDKQALIGESADVLYHLLVMWAATGIGPNDVAGELTRREGMSGLAEKKLRNT